MESDKIWKVILTGHDGHAGTPTQPLVAASGTQTNRRRQQASAHAILCRRLAADAQ